MAYKVNLHITRKCNYNCKYCFAHFERDEDLTLEAWKGVVDNLKDSGIVDAINFAGGEPVLYPHFAELTDYAYDKGFKLSIITNGSLMLNPKLMPKENFAKFDTLGISVDSITPKTLVNLGACTPSKEVLTYDDLKELIIGARTANPNIRIKLNTVITNLNYNEDLNIIGRELDISRWKMLKMKLFSDGHVSNAHLMVDEVDFDNFVTRHGKVSKDVVPESELTRSYIMVDNLGRLLDDETENYEVVGSLLTEPFAEVFNRYSFDEALYSSRYAC